MASILNTLTRPFRPSPDNSPPADQVEKSDTKSFAMGYMPGSTHSLRDNVMGQPVDADYDLLYRIYEINTDVSGSVDQWISVATSNDWQVRLDPKYLKPGQDIDEATQKLINQVTSWMENPAPDKGLKFDELVAETIIDLGVCGDAYWEVVRDKNGVPIEVSNIHPSTMRVVTDELGVIYGYIQRVNGKVVARFEPKQIMHFKLPSRKSDLYGQSPLERALEEITQDIKAMVANKSLLDNGFNPGAILLLEPEANNEDNAKKIQSMIKQAHGGTNRWHRLMALMGVKDIKPWGNTLQDMQFVDLRDLATTKVATAFGVPKLFLNLKESGDFATSDVMERQLYKNKGRQIQRLLNAMITEDLIQAFDERLQFVLNQPDFSDSDALRKDAIDLFKANKNAISINELRTKHFGLEEIDEEELAAKEEEERQRQMEQMQAKQPDKGETAKPETDAKDVETDDAKKSFVAKAIDDEIDPLAIERDKEMDDLEQPFKMPIDSYFNDQESHYLSTLPEQLTDLTLDTYLSAGAPAMDAAFALLLGSLVYAPLRAGISAATQQAHAAAGESVDTNLRIDLSLRFDQVNPVVQQYIQTTAFEHVKGINETTRSHLRATLAEGLRKGEGVPQLSERIAQVFGRARDYRTDLIARNETAQAFAHANHDTLALLFKEGIVKRRQWKTAPEDGRVCPICRPLNNYTIRFDAKYPDDLEPGRAHISCRCTEIGLFGDEEDS